MFARQSRLLDAKSGSPGPRAAGRAFGFHNLVTKSRHLRASRTSRAGLDAFIFTARPRYTLPHCKERKLLIEWRPTCRAWNREEIFGVIGAHWRFASVRFSFR